MCSSLTFSCSVFSLVCDLKMRITLMMHIKYDNVTMYAITMLAVAKIHVEIWLELRNAFALIAALEGQPSPSSLPY